MPGGTGNNLSYSGPENVDDWVSSVVDVLVY